MIVIALIILLALAAALVIGLGKLVIFLANTAIVFSRLAMAAFVALPMAASTSLVEHGFLNFLLWMGISFGVLFGILPEKALENLMQEAYGIPSIMPPFPGLFHKERPGRHNNLVWPFLNGFYIQAAAGAGKVNLAGEELKKMAALYNSNEGIFEIYNPYDGSVDGGWQIGGDDLQGHLWDSCPDQTWSATSYIGAVLQGIFGIRMEEEGIRFAPCVPEFLKDSSVHCLVIRGKKFHVTLSGFGTEVAEMTVNGKTVDTARLSYADAEENNEIVLTLK